MLESYRHLTDMLPLSWSLFCRFTKYCISLPELHIDREDYTFASYLDGYTTHNKVGRADSCQQSSVQASFIFNITGKVWLVTRSGTGLKKQERVGYRVSIKFQSRLGSGTGPRKTRQKKLASLAK